MPFLHCRENKHQSNKYVRIKLKNGYHVKTIKNLMYEGDWVNDLRNGFGVSSKKLPDKRQKLKYQGYWRNDKRHGEGNGHLKHDGYYVGEWKVGRRNGYGSMWYPDGSFYDGNWADNRRSGLGMFVQVDGNRYEGEWQNDKRHGVGRLFFLDTGQMQEGLWLNDAAVCTTIADIPFRQTAVFPTAYPIPPVKLQCHEHVLDTNQYILQYGVPESRTTMSLAIVQDT